MTTAVPSLQTGMLLQQSGAVAQAAAVYAAILATQPSNMTARTLLGLAWCQGDQAAAGISLLREVEAADQDALAQFSLGQAFATLGRFAEAASAFRRSIAVLPGVAASHAALGDALRQDGQPAAAAAAYRAALRLGPQATLYLALGRALRQCGDAAAAAQAYRDGLRIDPHGAELWCGLANVLVVLGDAHEALTACHLALAMSPGMAAAHYNRGNALRLLGEPERAVTAFQAALAAQPDFAEALCNLSAALYDLDLLTDAAAAAEAALAVRPAYPEALTNLGNARQALLQYQPAEDAFRAVLAQQPDAAAHSNLSVVLTATDRLPEALAAQHVALALAPDFADARYNHAVTLLKAGDYAAGWRFYETRWELPWSPPRGFAQPQWQGEPLAGRTILLHAEQGLGDTLHMARYAPLVAARGGRVVLEVQRPLVRLLRSLPGVAAVLAVGDALPAFDLHCPLFSLPLAFGTVLATVPNAPYLRADPALAAQWADRMPDADGLRVGLVWGGAARIGSHVNRARSVDPTLLAPLGALPGIGFYSLQLQEGRPAAAPAIPGIELTDLTAAIADFADTAALVEQLDLVISVDTSTAHLAAAMGKPVWLLSRHNGCWRWLAERQDSPWYPSLTIFRQDRPRDWTGVLAAVTTALSRLSQRPA